VFLVPSRALQKNSSPAIVILDIETSGLDPNTDSISLVGIADEQGIHQYRTAVEAALYLRALSQDSILLTYNGLAFDYSFLDKNMPPNQPFPRFQKHIDLLPIAETHFKHRVSKDAACHNLGIWLPADPASGADCASFAKQAFRPLMSFEKVCLHNAQDLYATRALYEKFKALGVIKNESPT